MDKITVPFECPNCHVQKKLKKAPDMRSGKMKCPNCQTQIRLVFDIDADPQTATASIIQEQGAQEQIAAPLNNPAAGAKKKTVYEEAPSSYSAPANFPEADHGMQVPPKSKTVVVGGLRNQPELTQDIFLNRLGKNGKKIVEKYQIYEGVITIGRYDPVVSSDIMFDHDAEMSRQSVQLSVVPTMQGVVCRLKVLKATNPVTIGTHILVTGEEMAVNFGDVITLGRTRIVISAH